MRPPAVNAAANPQHAIPLSRSGRGRSDRAVSWRCSIQLTHAAPTLPCLILQHGASQIRCASHLQKAAERWAAGTQTDANARNRLGPNQLFPEWMPFALQEDARYTGATQLVSIAPTQDDGSDAAAAEAAAPPLALLLPSYVRAQREEKRPWGLQQEASYFQELDQEQLAETEEVSRQTTPAGSRAASPGPCTAPQQRAADLAAIITQQMQQQQYTPCSEEIARHYPRVQASWVMVWQQGGSGAAHCAALLECNSCVPALANQTCACLPACLALNARVPCRSGMPSTLPAWRSSSWSRCGCRSSSGTARTEASRLCSSLALRWITRCTVQLPIHGQALQCQL